MSVLHDNDGRAIGNNNPLPMRSMQQRWRAGFTGTELNPSKWEIVQVGAGQSISVANGTLTMNMGTVADAETIIRAKASFDVPFRTMAHLAMSQRIAGNEVYLEMISVDKETGEPDSNSKAAWMFDGTTSTTNKYITNGGDQPELVSAATTSSSTATAGSIFEIEPTTDECWFFSRTADSTAGRAYSFVRHTQIPNPMLRYTFQIRIKNQSTPPATDTVVTSQFINISDYAEITAEITAGRGSAVAGQGIYATVGGTISTVTTVTTGYASSKHVYVSHSTAAITTATPMTTATIDAGTTSYYTRHRFRVIYDQPVKVEFINGSSSTMTSNRVSHTENVAANTPTIIEVPLIARYAAIRITNTGAATTTIHECLGIQLGQ